MNQLAFSEADATPVPRPEAREASPAHASPATEGREVALILGGATLAVLGWAAAFWSFGAAGLVLYALALVAVAFAGLLTILRG